MGQRESSLISLAGDFDDRLSALANRLAKRQHRSSITRPADVQSKLGLFSFSSFLGMMFAVYDFTFCCDREMAFAKSSEYQPHHHHHPNAPENHSLLSFSAIMLGSSSSTSVHQTRQAKKTVTLASCLSLSSPESRQIASALCLSLERRGFFSPGFSSRTPKECSQALALAGSSKIFRKLPF